VSHKKGKYTRSEVIEIYKFIISELSPRVEQEGKIKRDINKLRELPEGRYHIVIRRRTGESSEFQTVLLKEYGVIGRHHPVFTSEFIVWRAEEARKIKEMLKEV